MGKVWEWITQGVAFLFGYLKGIIGHLFGKVLATFGLTMISFEVILPQITAYITQFVSGMPAEALNFLGYIGLGKAMSMVLSALTVAGASKVMIVPKSVAQTMGQ